MIRTAVGILAKRSFVNVRAFDSDTIDAKLGDPARECHAVDNHDVAIRCILNADVRARLVEKLAR
jgi:hypothetical protein